MQKLLAGHVVAAGVAAVLSACGSNEEFSPAAPAETPAEESADIAVAPDESTYTGAAGRKHDTEEATEAAAGELTIQDEEAPQR